LNEVETSHLMHHFSLIHVNEGNIRRCTESK